MHQIAVIANQVDIEAGKLAKSKSTSPKVKDFAQLMITDHTGVNQSATDLVNKLDVTPQENPTSQSLKKGGEKNIAKLKSLEGAAFDKAYIDHEIVYHQQVIDALSGAIHTIAAPCSAARSDVGRVVHVSRHFCVSL